MQINIFLINNDQKFMHISLKYCMRLSLYIELGREGSLPPDNPIVGTPPRVPRPWLGRAILLVV